MANAKRGRFKGHCMMCAIQRGAMIRGTRRGRDAVPTLRLMGRSRRIGRHDIPADQLL